MSKTWWTSKTLWVNVLAIAAAIVTNQAGIEINAETQVSILGVINLILRIVTKEPVNW